MLLGVVRALIISLFAITEREDTRLAFSASKLSKSPSKISVSELALRNSSYIDSGELQALWRQYGADEQGFVSLDDAERMKKDHPEYSRDIGADILNLVQSHPEGMKLWDSIEFAADGLFCEWAWVIDLDKRTFEAYEGFGKEPLTESDRFYFLKDLEEDGYSAVKLMATWGLDELPSDEDFLAAFKEE